MGLTGLAVGFHPTMRLQSSLERRLDSLSAAHSPIPLSWRNSAASTPSSRTRICSSSRAAVKGYPHRSPTAGGLRHDISGIRDTVAG